MIFRLVWENIRFRPLRTLLSILLIGVPVMLILTLKGVASGFMEDSKQRSRGVGFDIIVRPPNSSFSSGSNATMSQLMVPKLGEQPHVVQSTGVVISLTGKLPWNSLAGIDYPAFKKMIGGFTFIEGDDAHVFQQPDDIVVDSDYAAEQHPNLHVGSETTALNQKWHVCAVVETGKMSHAFVQIGRLQDLSNAPGKITQIYLKLDDPRNTDAVVRQLDDLIAGYTVLSMKDYLDLISPDKIPAIGVFVNVIIGIGVFTGLIVVSLSMYMAVLQRTREIGILKSLGATKAFVMSLILWEAGAMGVGGTIAGIALSYASKAVLKKFVPASLPQAIVVEWWPIVLGIALGSALLGALYPGMIAVRQDPIEALAYE
jgi:putative ABC transport system permease protein